MSCLSPGASGSPDQPVALSLAIPRAKLEKEKERARIPGVIQAELLKAEIAEDLQKERRTFQLQMCEVGRLMVVPLLLGCSWFGGPCCGNAGM